ncbi:MAG: ABC-2 family transporter protein [Oligoflexia bacterium]|nr:ABC-2 family transporter protein [Oligoflexia bacterium]
MSLISVYGSFIRNAFLKMLAYRARYYTGIATYLFFVAVYYFIWQAIFAGKPEGYRISGYTLPEMLTYVSVGWIARSFYFSNIDDEMDDLVRSGQISVYLLRPVNFQAMMIFQAVGEALFRITFFSLPVGAVILLCFPINPPPSSADFLLFALSTALGFLTMASINFLVGLLAFYFKSVDGIMRAKYNLINLFSGLLLPLSFLPDWLRVAMEVLPFKSIAYVPLNFYLGKVPPEQIGSVLAGEFAWAFGLLAAGMILWTRAASRLTLQGG